MSSTKAVTVVHPDSKVRIALRTVLEAHGCAVATDHSIGDLLSGADDFRPNLILLDRSLLAREGIEVLSQLNQKWEETELLFLPEGLGAENQRSALTSQLLVVIDRLLSLRTTREMLAV
jgi:DNA-binding response OmpR family regulator